MQTPTIKIKDDSKEGFAFINEEDFNREKHELYAKNKKVSDSKTKAKARKVEKKPEAKSKLSKPKAKSKK